MFEILESQTLVPNIHQLTVRAPDVARSMKPGQFVILRAIDGGERIPLTASDWDGEQGTVTVVFLVVGNTTRLLATMKAGDSLPTVVGPLGNPLELPQSKTVLCVGGCYGIASLYPTARELKKMGNRVLMLVEARSGNLFFWNEKLRSVSDAMYFVTRDGTQGYRGHIAKNLPQVIGDYGQAVDQIIINGCNYLMKRGSDASRPLGIKTMVSLNTLMIDGTGMCGVCRVSIDHKMKFACVDGPYFDGHQVDWDELAQRRRSYLPEEVVPLRSSRAEPRQTDKQKESAYGHAG